MSHGTQQPGALPQSKAQNAHTALKNFLKLPNSVGKDLQVNGRVRSNPAELHFGSHQHRLRLKAELQKMVQFEMYIFMYQFLTAFSVFTKHGQSIQILSARYVFGDCTVFVSGGWCDNFFGLKLMMVLPFTLSHFDKPDLKCARLLFQLSALFFPFR